ncbi:NAD-dependent epimerase/dehydratase family protein, partial [Pelagibacterales bacterium SAG-MED02]|nr:NAD-dependent epimerase/dehydratase family protein [Pelagibacterales bacterium SAG-MED02]
EFEVSVVDSLAVNNYLSLKKQKIQNKKFYLKTLNQRQDLLKKNNINLIIEDARDYALVTRIIEKFKPNYLIHLAAVAHANVSNKDPYSTFDHSMRTLENTLDACRSQKFIDRFIYLSSSMVYGQFKKKIVTEKEICNPLGIYAALKFGSEKLVEGYNQVFDLPYTIIRPSALYGQRCVSGRVVQKFIEAALKGKKLEVVGDGKETLDFTYIDDFMQGVFLTMTNKNSLNETFNITYGKSRSLVELINIIKDNITKVKIKYIKRDKLMPFRGTLSVNKAKSLLGYNPAHSLEKAVPKYIKWYVDSKF